MTAPAVAILAPIQVVRPHNRNCDLGDVDVLGDPYTRHRLKSRSGWKGWREVLDEGTQAGEEKSKAPDLSTCFVMTRRKVV